MAKVCIYEEELWPVYSVARRYDEELDMYTDIVKGPDDVPDSLVDDYTRVMSLFDEMQDRLRELYHRGNIESFVRRLSKYLGEPAAREMAAENDRQLSGVLSRLDDIEKDRHYRVYKGRQSVVGSEEKKQSAERAMIRDRIMAEFG